MTHREAEAWVRSDEAEGDGSVAAGGREDQWDPALGGARVRWWVEVRTLPPWVQAGACPGARWLGAEVREGGGVRGDPGGGGRGPGAGEVCTAPGEAGGREVQEGGAGRGVRDLEGGRGPWGLENL